MSSYVIIGIHGLANKPPKEIHSKEWVASIKEGLSRNCMFKIDELNFKLIYWADINHKKPLMPDKEPNIPTPQKEKILNYKENAFSRYKAKFPELPPAIVQGAIDFVGLSAAANAILTKKLKDLQLYYKSKENQNALRALVKEEIVNNQNKRIMLIAHSMGSFVAYDALRELGQENSNYQVDNFVTIGSPLGIPYIASKIQAEWKMRRTPSIVKRWVNHADKSDMVAFDPHLWNDYDSNDQGVRVEDDLIYNNYINSKGKANHHKIYGYLRTPEMSNLIRGVV
jgi:hypothetical protein